MESKKGELDPQGGIVGLYAAVQLWLFYFYPAKNDWWFYAI